MKKVLLLLLFTVSRCDNRTVTGRTGQNVTLPCTYDIKANGEQSICWGKGTIPSSGCKNQIIATGSYKTKEENSSKYQLLGQLDQGDVSLTILNLTESDAGQYGCRVEISGWFNDEKHHFDLTIEPATQTNRPKTSTPKTTTEMTATNQTTGHMTATESTRTSSFSIYGNKKDDSRLTVILVVVLFGLIFLVTVGVLFIMRKRWRKINKMPQQQQVGSVVFGPPSASPALQLQNRQAAVDNIYQMDGGGDGGEYELCP
ncbi:T-cell immunoglobulin and mucin domain-containing protein 4-like [Pholidichthys leucotaenia]